MQYVLHAYDYTDEEAPERRQKVRPEHLETARRLKEQGHFILGGALLSPTGQMIGSMMVVDFEKESDLEHWLASDPYSTGRVWEKIDIKPFRQAQV